MSPALADGQFPWHLFILFQILRSSICYPTPNVYIRQWILAPAMMAIAIHLYTKHAYLESPTAYPFGTIIAIQLCSMTHLVYAQNGFPDFWRRVKDENADDKCKLPSRFSFRKKVVWALDLSFGIRKVGWIQEATDALPPHPNCSRGAFVRSRMIYVLVHWLTLDLLVTHQAGNPAFDPRVHHVIGGPEEYIRSQALLWRMTNIVSWGLETGIGISFMYNVVSVVFVGIGISDPTDWPPMFGSFQDAYTLQRFWGRSWHQMLRPSLSGIGKFVARDVCRFKRGTNLSSYTQLYIAFFLSGLIHIGGDYMVVGYIPSFSLRFFLLQAVAISFENFVIWIAKPIWSKMDHRVNRTVGYLWVIMWFCWVGPLWLGPMSANGVYICDRGAISGRVLDLWKA